MSEASESHCTDLSEHERQALMDLAAEHDLPPGAEGRMLRALAARRLIQRQTPWWMAAGRATALVLLLGAAFFAGVEYGGSGRATSLEPPRAVPEVIPASVPQVAYHLDIDDDFVEPCCQAARGSHLVGCPGSKIELIAARHR